MTGSYQSFITDLDALDNLMPDAALESMIQEFAATEGAVDVFKGAWEALKKFIRTIINWFKSLPGKAREFGRKCLHFITRTPDVVEDEVVEQAPVDPGSVTKVKVSKKALTAEMEHAMDEYIKYRDEVNRIVDLIDKIKAEMKALDRDMPDYTDKYTNLKGQYAMIWQYGIAMQAMRDDAEKRCRIWKSIRKASNPTIGFGRDSFLAATEAIGGPKISIKGIKDKIKLLLRDSESTSNRLNQSVNDLDRTVKEAEMTHGSDPEMPKILTGLAQMLANLGQFIAQIPTIATSAFHAMFPPTNEEATDSYRVDHRFENALEECLYDLDRFDRLMPKALTMNMVQNFAATEGAKELLGGAWRALKELAKKVASFIKSIPSTLMKYARGLMDFTRRAPDYIDEYDDYEPDEDGEPIPSATERVQQVEAEVIDIDAKFTRLLQGMSALEKMKGYLEAGKGPHGEILEESTIASLEEMCDAELVIIQDVIDTIVRSGGTVSDNLTQDYQKLSTYFQGRRGGASEAVNFRGRISIVALKNRMSNLLKTSSRAANDATKTSSDLEKAIDAQEAGPESTAPARQRLLSKITRALAFIGKILSMIPKLISGWLKKLFPPKPKSQVVPYTGPAPQFG